MTLSLYQPVAFLFLPLKLIYRGHGASLRTRIEPVQVIDLDASRPYGQFADGSVVCRSR